MIVKHTFRQTCIHRQLKDRQTISARQTEARTGFQALRRRHLSQHIDRKGEINSTGMYDEINSTGMYDELNFNKSSLKSVTKECSFYYKGILAKKEKLRRQP